MDEREVLILTRRKGEFEDATRDIRHIVDLGGKLEITFNQGRKYAYNKNNVRYFSQPETIDIDRSIIRIKGERDQPWDSAIVFGPYIRLFHNQRSYLHRRENVEIIPNIAANESTRRLVEYYRYIANCLKEKTPHLNIYYENKLDVIREDSVSRNFIDRTAPHKRILETPPIFPFGVNPSQRQAVINALETQISLIQGPPGTGKTHTILNIVANLVVRGKTVAIVAGNNSATANVHEKLEEQGIGFISSRLGNKDLQNEFFASEHEVPDISSWVLSREDDLKSREALTSIDKRLIRLLNVKNQLAIVKERADRLAIEKQYFERHFPIEPVKPEKWSFANEWATPNLLKFLAELEYYSQHDTLPWLIKLRWLFRYRIFRFKGLSRIDDTIVRGIVREYYDKRAQELKNEQESLRTRLSTHDFDVLLEQYTQTSLQLFKSDIASRYQGMEKIDFGIHSYKKSFPQFLQRFPVVLSTADSIINNKNPMDLFDYLIVDEASQVDLLTGFLAMSCAKNIVAVGDLRQLPHIPDALVTDVQKPVDGRFNTRPGYSYLHDSLLSSLNTLFTDTAPTTLLKEHYRCHPRIIDFCNRKFYDGQLVIMTDASNEPFKVLKTVPGNHARRPASGKSLQNVRELDVIQNEVLDDELKDTPRSKIGVATPYRAQADKAKEHITADGLQIDTVYKYQGREKDVIIFSTTASYLNNFVDNPHLLNVAVSRAMRRFIMVTSKDVFRRQGSNIGDLIRHIEYQSLSDSIFESKTVSIFDCLYREYSGVLKEFLGRVKGTSRFPSENLMAALLDEVLARGRYRSFAYETGYALSLLINDYEQFTARERQFASHPNSHVDFLLYNKLDKLPVLSIEVDGYRFHELNEKQLERDRTKDSIFEKLGIPLLRFSTVGSGEREKLEAALNGLLVDLPRSREEQLESPL